MSLGRPASRNALLFIAVAVFGIAVSGCCKSESSAAPTSASGWIAKADGVSGCSKQSGAMFAVSPQAKNAYTSMVESLASEGFLAKGHASYSCGGQEVGLYAYEYDTHTNSLNAFRLIKALVWGREGKTANHPERIVQKQKVILVVSSQDVTAIDGLL